MVEQMKPGSVVVDLASEQGGNVEGSVAGTELTIGDALVWGGANVASQMAGPVPALRSEHRQPDPADDAATPRSTPTSTTRSSAAAASPTDGSVLHEPTRPFSRDRP
jgi:NAD(P) transhydrogenase subunit alpha